MSKSNYGEFVGLLQYIDSVRAKEPKGLFRKPKKEKALSNIEVLMKAQQEAAQLKQFFDDQVKLNKKEDKDKDKEKKGWDAMSPLQQAVYITFGMQIMSLMYFSFLFKLLK